MKRVSCLLVLLLLCLCTPWSSPSAETVYLSDLEQEALANNPEIAMAAARAIAARERSKSASALPNPMIGVDYQNVGRLTSPTIGKEEMSMAGIVVTQEIPFPGKLSARGRAADRAASREDEGLRETRLRILSELRSAYYEYVLAWRAGEILERSRELMTQFQRIAETRYATGQAVQADALRAQIEVSRLLDQIVDQRWKQEALEALINSLVGRDPRTPLGRPAPLSRRPIEKTLDELSSMALDHSPTLAAKQRMIEQSALELSLSKREYLPDLTVSAGWFSRGDFPDVWQASVMFTVPLYFRNTAAGVRAAKASLSSTRHEYDAARLALLAKLRDLYALARASEHHLAIYESAIIPQARMALRSAASSYQVGRVDFMTLVEAKTLVLTYELSYEEELVRLHKTLSTIGELTGSAPSAGQGGGAS